MPTKRSGFISCIARNTGASFASMAWTPLIRIRGIKGNRAPAGTPDTSDRQADIYSTIPTRYKIGYDFDGLWDGGAGLAALRNAFVNRTAIDLAALDAQPAQSGVGYRGEWAVTKFSLDFPLVGEQKASISIKPYGNHTTGQAVAAYTDATVSAGAAETPGTKKLGKAGSVNSSGGTPYVGVMDFKLNLEWAEWNASDRRDDFDKVNMNQLKVSAELNFIWDSTEFADFQTAWLSHSAINLWILDGAYATSGSWGVRANWAITDYPKEDELTDGQKITCKLEPHGQYSTALSFETRP